MHHNPLVLVEALEHALSLEILNRQHRRVERHPHLVEDVRHELLLGMLGAPLHRLCRLQLVVLRAELLAEKKYLPISTLAPVRPQADVDVVQEEADGLADPGLRALPVGDEEDHAHDEVDGGGADGEDALAPEADGGYGWQAEEEGEHVDEDAFAAFVAGRVVVVWVSAAKLVSAELASQAPSLAVDPPSRSSGDIRSTK